MSARRDLTEQHAQRYRRAGKKEKGRILDGFVESTGYKRKYAIQLLVDLRDAAQTLGPEGESIRPLVVERS